MGPTLIFDKSTLESLNADEALWLDTFFLCNITPLFFIETLADLEKSMRGGRTAEEVVGTIAYKTPDASSAATAHHRSLLAAELSGRAQIEMGDGRPIVPGGEAVELAGKTGVIFKQSPEVEAFQRWQKGDFLLLERSTAKEWRRALSAIDLEKNYAAFQTFFPMGKPKTLDDVKRFTDFYIDSPDREIALAFGLDLVGIPEHTKLGVLQRWREAAKPPLREFAPYFAHVYSVLLFFNLGLAADIIGRGRASHTIDVAYLFYLPFCNVFSSNDKLHAQVVPHFLRDNQMFIPGADLKADLAELDAHYSALPPEVKERGVMSFAHYPPPDDSFLVARIWNRFMAPGWQKRSSSPVPRPNKADSENIMNEMKEFRDKAKAIPEGAVLHGDSADSMLIERHIYPKKGKWMRVPPEALNRRKNANGEWEDIPAAEHSDG